MSETADGERNLFHEAIYLAGATATGKTAVGVELAERLGGEIFALDSMTLYRGMDIGTAKPTIAERRGVPHHLIDVIDPSEAASVAQYRGWAADALADVRSRGRVPLFVGGTALYLKALLRGLFEGPSADPDLRAELEAEAEASGDQALHQRLAVVDPPTAARLHPNDRRRVIRALEVQALTGRRLSDLQAEHDRPAPPTVAVIALTRPRSVLHDRINRRVEAMFAQGLIQETERLRDRIHPIPAQGVGYRETLDLLSGKIRLKDAVEFTQARTRQFAKRQETWFRGLSEVKLWPVADDEPPETTADRLLSSGALGLMSSD